MNLSLIAVVFLFILVGIPAFAGAYILVSDIGHRRSSGGIVLIVYSLVLGGTAAYLMPEGKISGDNYLVAFPVVFLVSVCVAALIAYRERKRS